MAATVSPTPLPVHSTFSDVHRRPSSRTTARPFARRPYTTRSPPISALVKSAARLAEQSTGDSSDDDDLAPIKLSAAAQAILDEASQSGSPSKSDELEESQQPTESSRRPRQSPSDRFDGSPAPRVVRIGSGARPTALTTLARDGSFMYKTQEKTVDIHPSRPYHEARTPAAGIRTVRINGSRNQTKSPPSAVSSGRDVTTNGRSGGASESKTNKIYVEESSHRDTPDNDHAPAGPSTIMRPRRAEENAAHSTMRVRRIGAGTFLNGPVRRGMIRRQSQEDDMRYDRQSDVDDSPELQQGRGGNEADLLDVPDDIPARARMSPVSPVAQAAHNTKSSYTTAESRERRNYSPLSRSPSPPRTSASAAGSQPSSKSSNSKLKPIFKIPSLPPLPSTHDQENEPPPTFKRARPSTSVLGEIQKHITVAEDKPQDEPTPASASPVRQPLAERSHNTPHRPAPVPPPKMSMIETATSHAGSLRSKKPVHLSVNGKLYRRLDCIGRGGSSRVFRVMAENYKIYALKRVNLEDADMAALAGCKGEIDLLKKLEKVDRVIRLIDYELNESKGVLNVMMELGESDFNKMLNEQIKTEDARLDVSFTRYYWKEMLECVQAVHHHGIVHSDLKPANFLLVRGQLKLIDFGIANAIQDNTVNVHRENQIGTPNYMSPESLVCHAPAAGAAAGTKLLKLGKPSDVWSLGCILYQMTYGQPPFAHITKPFERIMSIPNPKVEIAFPSTGVGGAVVPFGLIKTLRRCLQREQALRPTIAELLGDADPFLHPVAISPDMLGRMISNVISYCRRKEDALKAGGQLIGPSPIPSDADMKAWPWAFYDKLRQAQEDGTAW